MSPSASEWLGDEAPRGAAGADLATAADAALAGGHAAMAHYGSDALAVRQKGEDDPVTAADGAANRAILGVLASRAPGEPVLSEESGAPDLLTSRSPRAAGADPAFRGSAGPGRARRGRGRDSLPSGDPPRRLWVVDPLDGTKEFLARNGEFSVMVGLALEGRAALGAVYQPDPDRLFLGLAGGGAWAVAETRQRPLARRLELRPGPPRPLRLVLSRSHGDPAMERLIDELDEVEVVRSGSVGIKCALIAAGAADLYVHPVPHLKEWDTCAPEAVLRGAGGRVTDCGGGPLGYGKRDPRQPRGIFAARPDVWRRAEPAVRAAAEGLLGSGGDGA